MIREKKQESFKAEQVKMKLRYGGGYATPVRPVLKVSPVVVNVVYSPVSDTSVCYNAMSTETNSPVSVSKMTANATDKSVISLMARLYEDQGLPPQESSVVNMVCPFRPAAMSKLKKQSAKMV